MPDRRPARKPCGTVTVAAASDLTYAMNEVAANFQKATGCTVRLSLGSSGNFLTQIENGAPFDVFFSADILYPQKLEAMGLAAPGSTYLYAIGKIVLWTREGSRVDVTQGFSALRDSALKRSPLPIRSTRRTGAPLRKRCDDQAYMNP